MTIRLDYIDVIFGGRRLKNDGDSRVSLGTPLVFYMYFVGLHNG